MVFLQQRALQWGRSVNAAETPLRRRQVGAPLRLQWGRSVNAAETCVSMPIRMGCSSFNGAAALTLRKRDRQARNTQVSQRFNGAAALTLRKPAPCSRPAA